MNMDEFDKIFNLLDAHIFGAVVLEISQDNDFTIKTIDVHIGNDCKKLFKTPEHMLQLLKYKERPVGYYFDGACMPGKGNGGYKTFSVGIFYWDGKSRGHTVYRVRGNSADAEKIYARAAQICAEMDAGTWEAPNEQKSEKIRGGK